MREIRMGSETIDVTAAECAKLCQFGLIAWREEVGAYCIRTEIGKDWSHVDAALAVLRK